MRALRQFALIPVLLGGMALAGCQGETRMEPTALEVSVQDSLTQNADYRGLAVTVLTAEGMSSASAGEASSGVPMSSATPFRIASVTKPFVAATVLKLMERGELDLDAPIVELMDAEYNSLLLSGGYDTSAITLRHLMMHTSGLVDHGTDGYLAAILADTSRQWTPLEQVAFAVNEGAPLGEPNAQFSYSDTGYVIIGHILERHSGQDLAGIVRQEIDYDALGLTSTWWEQKEAIPSGLPNRARQTLDGFDITDWNPSVDLYGGGGLVSTTEDLARFMKALMEGGVFENDETLRVMLDAPGHPFPDQYRLGIFPGEMGGEAIFFHGGFWGVFALYAPDQQTAMAAVSLDQSGYDAIRAIMAEELIRE